MLAAKLTRIFSLATGIAQQNCWRIYGALAHVKLARKLKGHWYGGGLLRVIDALFSDESLGSDALHISVGEAF